MKDLPTEMIQHILSFNKETVHHKIDKLTSFKAIELAQNHLRERQKKLTQSFDLKKNCVYFLQYRTRRNDVEDGFILIQNENLHLGRECITYCKVKPSSVKRKFGYFEIISDSNYLNIKHILEHELVYEPTKPKVFCMNKRVGCMQYRLLTMYHPSHIVKANLCVAGEIVDMFKSNVVIRIQTDDPEYILEFVGSKTNCYELK